MSFDVDLSLQDDFCCLGSFEFDVNLRSGSFISLIKNYVLDIFQIM